MYFAGNYEGDWPRKYQLDSILISPMLELKLNLIDIFLASPLHSLELCTLEADIH